MRISTEGNGIFARLMRMLRTYMMAQERMSRGNYDTAYETYLKSQSPDPYKNEEAMTIVVDNDFDGYEIPDNIRKQTGR